MAADLPAGAKIPVTFSPGDIVTADTLNQLQTELLNRILTHTHAGNTAADPQGLQIGSAGLADAAIKANHMSAGSVDTIALAYHSVTRDRLAWPVVEELGQLGAGIAADSERIDRLDEHFHNDRKMIVHLEEQVAHQAQRMEELAEELRHQSQRSEILEERLLTQVHRNEQLTLMLARQTERIDRLEEAAGARPTTWGHFRVSELLTAAEDHPSHNVREVEVIFENDVEILELRFHRPYRTPDYTCVVTPESEGLHTACSLTPVVMQRSRYGLRIAFWDGGEWRARDLSWNVVIFGELAGHD